MLRSDLGLPAACPHRPSSRRQRVAWPVASMLLLPPCLPRPSASLRPPGPPLPWCLGPRYLPLHNIKDCGGYNQKKSNDRLLSSDSRPAPAEHPGALGAAAAGTCVSPVPPLSQRAGFGGPAEWAAGSWEAAPVQWGRSPCGRLPLREGWKAGRPQDGGSGGLRGAAHRSPTPSLSSLCRSAFWAHCPDLGAPAVPGDVPVLEWAWPCLIFAHSTLQLLPTDGHE